MRVLASLLSVAALAGCASQTYVAIDTGGSTVTAVPPGTAATSSTVVVTATGTSAAWVFASVAFLGFAFYGHELALWDDPRGLDGTPLAPPLAPDRVVHEQDCSKPIENPRANLRCK